MSTRTTWTWWPPAPRVVRQRAVGHAESVPRARARGNRRLSGIPAQNVHGTAQAPLLPYRLSNFVLAILGLTTRLQRRPRGKADHEAAKPQSGSSTTAWRPSACLTAATCRPTSRSMYNLDGLYNDGATGSGQTIAIVTLAALDQGAPQYFWSNIAHVTRTGSLAVDNIDGGPGAPSAASGTVETDLDLEQSGALAPGANVITTRRPTPTSVSPTASSPRLARTPPAPCPPVG